MSLRDVYQLRSAACEMLIAREGKRSVQVSTKRYIRVMITVHIL
jgi:hypothetical protein